MRAFARWLPAGVQFSRIPAVYMKGGKTDHDGRRKNDSSHTPRRAAPAAEGRIRELERRQDDLEKLASSVAMLAQRQEDMDANIREIKKDVGQMAQKAGRRWDMIVEKAIAAIVGALSDLCF